MIGQRIEKRMYAWEAGRHGMIVEETLWKCNQYLTTSYREDYVEHRSKTYHSLVICEKLRMAVRWITEQEKGGIDSPRITLHKIWEEGYVGAEIQTHVRTPPPILRQTLFLPRPTSVACPS